MKYRLIHWEPDASRGDRFTLGAVAELGGAIHHVRRRDIAPSWCGVKGIFLVESVAERLEELTSVDDEHEAASRFGPYVWASKPREVPDDWGLAWLDGLLNRE